MSDTHSTPEEMSSDEAKSFFAQAQEKVTDAVNAAIEAARGNPNTAAAIATGAAAAVGAAAYGVTKLRESETGAKSDGSKSDKK